MTKTRFPSDDHYYGKVYYSRAGVNRGVLQSPLYVHEFGAVETADTDGICVAATGSSTLSATGALVSGGVATMTTPRAILLTSTSLQAFPVTVAGTDVYGETMSEIITLATGALTKAGVKAFKTVTSLTVTGAPSTAIDVGTTDVLGLPLRLADVGKLISFTADGIADTSLTVVAGLASTGVSTTTSADVRGTIDPNTAANGSVRFTAMFVTDGNSVKEKIYGVDQA